MIADMIVVSDTTPLNYLILLEAIEVLPQLYGFVIIPPAVRQEMLHPKAPEAVRFWASQLPEWVILRQPRGLLPLSLDAGEHEAISLAVEIGADLILLDERRGREAAQAQALQVVGTLGILVNAARAGLLDLSDALTRLRQTTFHISEELIIILLDRLAAEQ